MFGRKIAESLGLRGGGGKKEGDPMAMSTSSIFEFTVKDIDGNDVTLSSLQDGSVKAFLVVNLASQ